MRDVIAALVQSIPPLDTIENNHLTEVTSWVLSEAPLFRTQGAAVPPRHLVAYCVVLDPQEKCILLADHIKAGLWLPSGGHVDPGEHPQETALRECEEELGIRLPLWHPTPFFMTLTVAQMKNPTETHEDVSFWYIMQGSLRDVYHFDRREFRSIKWYRFDDIPFEKTDPHMRRFIRKLNSGISKKPLFAAI